jgi:hypothetical protein
MQLPFDRIQFLDVFGRYNTTLWPVALGLWLLALAAAVLLIQGRHSADRVIAVLLPVLWLWSGVAYHAVFFTAINPAAWMFATLFVAEAGLLFWFGVMRRSLRFSSGTRPDQLLGALLVACALAYPAAGWIFGDTWPRLATFGVPCPTVLLTAGFLLCASHAGLTSIIPVIWSAIGGTAAVALGMTADWSLIVAGGALIGKGLQAGRHRDG